VGYGLANNSHLVAEARLQAVIRGPARATVTSVAGLSTEVVAVSCYAALLLGSTWWSAATLTALLGVPMIAVAWLADRWLPELPTRAATGGVADMGQAGRGTTAIAPAPASGVAGMGQAGGGTTSTPSTS
jgi:hypothetical protein